MFVHFWIVLRERPSQIELTAALRTRDETAVGVLLALTRMFGLLLLRDTMNYACMRAHMRTSCTPAQMTTTDGQHVAHATYSDLKAIVMG